MLLGRFSRSHNKKSSIKRDQIYLSSFLVGIGKRVLKALEKERVDVFGRNEVNDVGADFIGDSVATLFIDVGTQSRRIAAYLYTYL